MCAARRAEEWFRAPDSWERAYALAKAKLASRERELLDSTPLGESVFSVLMDAKDAGNDRNSKKWWWYIKDRSEIAVKRDKFDRIVKDLERYANIVDVAISQQSDIVSICWDSARFLLQVSVFRWVFRDANLELRN
jgi:hypothetical protein